MTTDTDVLKRAAAERAVELITSGTVVGLGTGSTMQPLLDALARRLRDGTVRNVVAVPTSVGYGASFKGIAPLLTMLNSCAPGVAVVNIDGGFNAGYMAGLINKRKARNFILECAARTRAHKFTRVAPCVYDQLEAVLRDKCRALIHSQPAKGKTIR